MRCAEPGGTSVRTGMVAVLDALQRRHGIAAEMSAVREVVVVVVTVGKSYTMRAERIRHDHGRKVSRPLGVRRPGEHSRHRGKECDCNRGIGG